MYQSISRPKHKDWGVIFGDEVSLQAKDRQFRLDSEFIRVKLTTAQGTKHVEYHAQVVPTPLPVNHRKENGLPLSVVIIGLDSLSAAHFQRALPEAYKFMKEEMNSVFLKGYSVVGDGTTPALAALMTGKQGREGRAGTKQDTYFCELSPPFCCRRALLYIYVRSSKSELDCIRPEGAFVHYSQCKKRVALRLESFATYAYSCRIYQLEFFIGFRLKNKNNSSGQMRQLQAYVANKYTLNFRKIDLFSSLHSIFCFLSFLPTAFSVATGKRWSCKEAQWP